MHHCLNLICVGSTVINRFLNSRTDGYNRRFSECVHIKVLFKFYYKHLIIKQFPSDELEHWNLHSCQLLLGRSYSDCTGTFFTHCCTLFNYLSVSLWNVKGNYEINLILNAPPPPPVFIHSLLYSPLYLSDFLLLGRTGVL